MGVQFDEGNIPRSYGGQSVPKIAAFMISKGWAKDVNGANKIQFIAAVAFFALSLFFFFK
ncbi:MAG: hypothetical protein RLZZ67_284 [Candidatus Parcubacteria bacterium]|jgi:hypothetical protein